MNATPESEEVDKRGGGGVDLSDGNVHEDIHSKIRVIIFFNYSISLQNCSIGKFSKHR